MATSKPTWAKVLGVILDLLQVAIALAVIVLTAWKLLDIQVHTENLTPDNLFDNDNTNNTNNNNTTDNNNNSIIGTGCVLDAPDEDDNEPAGISFCLYAIGVGVVSLVVNTVFACVRNVVKCVSCDACAVSRVVAIVGDVALAVWWGVAFALFVRRGGQANDAGLPNKTERDGVIALAFGGMTAFAVDAIITLWTILV